MRLAMSIIERKVLVFCCHRCTAEIQVNTADLCIAREQAAESGWVTGSRAVTCPMCKRTKQSLEVVVLPLSLLLEQEPIPDVPGLSTWTGSIEVAPHELENVTLPGALKAARKHAASFLGKIDHELKMLGFDPADED